MVRAINPQGLSDPSPMSDPVRTQGNFNSCKHDWFWKEALSRSLRTKGLCEERYMCLITYYNDSLDLIQGKELAVHLGECVLFWELSGSV